MQKVLAVIPARYGSTRFPGKPLAQIAGMSMIRRVVDRVKLCSAVDEIVVATDDQRIVDEVAEVCKVVMTQEHPNGTLRVNEVVETMGWEGVVLNVQGDEPLLNPKDLDELIKAVEVSGSGLGTLCCAIPEEEAEDPNRVKVVLSKKGKALYFSRSKVPFARSADEHTYYRHIGLYGFTNTSLAQVCTFGVSDLAEKEGLEQLTWLENDLEIACSIVGESPIGVDVPEDINTVEKLLKR